MVSIRSNRLLPLIGSGVLLMTVFVGFKACSNTAGDSTGQLATVPEAPAPDADTPAETIRTLTARVADMTAQMKALRDENADLKKNAGDLRRSITEQVMIEVKAEQARQTKPDDSHHWNSITARLDGLSRQVADLMTDTPLPVGQSLGLEEPSLSTGLVWTEPLDLAGGEPAGFSGFPQGLLRGPSRQAGDRKGHAEDTAPLTHRIKSKSKEPEPIPYYTVPRNATLIGSTGMTALIGRIPVKGRVEDPIPFKLIVGKDNLAANGLAIPHVAGMIWSGVAVGDWTLSCVTGRLDSVTFVFEDGAIRTLSSDRGKEPLGWISDDRGMPCISGERITNASAFLTKRIALTAAQAAAEAAAAAQTTTGVSAEGTGTSSVTGNLDRYVLGKALSGGSQEIGQWLQERERQSFDAVFVPPGMRLAVHVDQELPIDYDPTGRRLSHVTPTDPYRHPYLD